jgi:hypothetical protein
MREKNIVRIAHDIVFKKSQPEGEKEKYWDVFCKIKRISQGKR